MDQLRKNLTYLYHECGLAGLKAGTEVEDMTFAEIAFLQSLGDPNLPLIVKIGGPEARNDMRACRNIGVYGILAPMIESPYGLRNFVEAAMDIYRDEPLPYLAINVETVTAYENLDTILESPFFRSISQVTVGRSDLSASMNGKPDDEHVLVATGTIIRRATELGKHTSVGGTITPANAPLIRDLIKPSRINTRHMVFDLQRCDNIARAISLGLKFEEELYEHFSDVEPSKRSVYRARISATRDRIHAPAVLQRAAS